MNIRILIFWACSHGPNDGDAQHGPDRDPPRSHVWERPGQGWLDADPPGNKKHADVNETKETIEVMVIENKKE